MTYNVANILAESLYPEALAVQLRAALPEFASGHNTALIERVSRATLHEGLPVANFLQDAGNLATAQTIAAGARNLSLTMRDLEQETLDQDRQALLARSESAQRSSVDSGRSAGFYFELGLDTIMKPDGKAEARRAVKTDLRDVPLTEKLKHAPVLSVNGFDNRTAGDLVRDIVDHAWLMTYLEEKGVLGNYRDFLESVDIGPHTFLYSPHMELIASIGRAMRRHPNGERPTVAPHVIEQDIINLLDDGKGSPAALNGLAAFVDMEAEERQQALAVVQDVLVTTAVERAAQGPYWQWTDSSQRARRPLAWVDPDHISLTLEAVRSLQLQPTVYRAAQLATLANVERYLKTELAADDVKWREVGVPQTADDRGGPISAKKRTWFEDNYQRFVLGPKDRA